MSVSTSLLDSPPASVCLLRLSAIGDTCHALAILRALQAVWPNTRYTWIIGRVEHKLMSLVPDVEFISYDKRGGLRALRQVRRALAGRRFDVLLHMQVALRASLVASLVSADRRIGFDRARARELQWLFTNERIAARRREHVLDSLFGFTDVLGIPHQPPRWDVPLSAAAIDYARALISDRGRALLISPCSSHAARNWRAERYAAVADYAHTVHGLQVILCGGPSATERAMADAILGACRVPVSDQVGKDTLEKMLALMTRATALLTPDSGPAHMATMVNLPVIGLYAATNPARSGPYLSRPFCVDRYALAAERFLGRPVDELTWTTKIEQPGVMDLIEVTDVTAQLDRLMNTLLALP
jgi:heptosyltransferase I